MAAYFRQDPSTRPAPQPPLWYPFDSVVDYALQLDHSTIVILSAASLLLLFPSLLSHYRCAEVIVRPGVSLWLKLIVSSILPLLDLARFLEWRSAALGLSDPMLIATLLSFAASCSLVALIFLEHRRTLRSATVISAWLTASLLTELVGVESYFFDMSRHTIMALTYSAAAMKFLLLILVEMPKISLVLNKKQKDDIRWECTAGFWSRSLLIWFGQTFCIGFTKNLELNQLQEIDPEFCSEHLAGEFNKHWQLSDKSSRYCLFKTLSKMWISSTLQAVLARLVLSVFILSQVPYIQRLLLYMENDDYSLTTKVNFVTGVVIGHFGITIASAIAKELGLRAAVIVRGALCSAISAKALKLPRVDGEKSIAVRLCSTDAVQVAKTLPMFHDVWASAVELAVSLYFLKQFVGGAAFVALIPSIASTLFSWFCGKYLPASETTWRDAAQARRAQVSDLLSQLHVIKSIALDDVVADDVKASFGIELDALKYNRAWTVARVAAVVLLNTSSGPIVVGGSMLWASRSGFLAPQDAFTILACMARLAGPLDRIVEAGGLFGATMNGMARIQDYLLLEEIQDPRNTAMVTEGKESKMVKKHFAIPAKLSVDDCVIRIRNGLVVPQGSNKLILRSLNVEIRRYQLVMVTGVVGSGKSTLLRCLVGEAGLVGGEFGIEPGASAYCEQRAWLQYGTIRQNIVGDCDFEQEWYDVVVTACCLDDDIQRLPDGDESIVGNNGVNISGGQKQRVALARALYLRTPYLVLDDVFASLDLRTRGEVFTRLFGSSGLLKLMPTTVIMSTHTAAFLRAADKVYFINRNGRVFMHSDPTSAAFRNMLQEIRQIKVESKDCDGNDEDEELLTVTRQLTASQKEQGNHQISYIRRLGMYLQCLSYWDILAFTVCAFIGAIFESSPEKYVHVWLDKLPDCTMFFAGCFGIAMTACLLTIEAMGRLYFKVIPTSSMKLHNRLLPTMAGATLHFITSSDHSNIIDLLCDDLTHFSRQSHSDFARFTYQTFYISIRYCIIFSVSRCPLLLAPFTIASLILIYACYLPLDRKSQHMELETNAPLISHLTETSNGLRHIRAIGLQAKTMDRTFELLDVSQQTFHHKLRVECWLNLQIDTLQTAVAIVLVVAGVCYKQDMSAADLGLATTVLMTALKQNVQFAVEAWSGLWSSAGLLISLEDFIKTTPIEKDDLPEGTPPVPDTWPENGEIEFTKVKARYSEKADTPWVLRGINTVMPGDKKIGIAGRTGSGKSSLLLAILNFLDYGGDITIAGREISTIPRKILRQRITTISQDPIELDGSVLYNLCPWTMSVSTTKGNVHPDSVFNVLNRLGLWTKIVMNGGLGAPIRQMEFSEGEKQLFAIARSMLRALSTSSRIIIMDEPTSGLDPTTAEMAKEALAEVFDHHTVLMVAHEPESLSDAATVITMSMGWIQKSRTNTVIDNGEGSSVATNPFPGVNAPPLDTHGYYEALLDRINDPSLPPLPDRNQKAIDDLKRRWKKSQHGLAWRRPLITDDSEDKPFPANYTGLWMRPPSESLAQLIREETGGDTWHAGNMLDENGKLIVKLRGSSRRAAAGGSRQLLTLSNGSVAEATAGEGSSRANADQSHAIVLENRARIRRAKERQKGKGKEKETEVADEEEEVTGKGKGKKKDKGKGKEKAESSGSSWFAGMRR